MLNSGRSTMLRHLKANTVAYVALFIALGGSAYAAKPLITGADIEDDSVAGADVLESSLGTVPSAAVATSALRGLVVQVNERIVAPGSGFGIEGFCPSGWFAVGGGYSYGGGTGLPDVAIDMSRYLNNVNGSGWRVTGINRSPNTVGVRVDIQCIRTETITLIDTPSDVIPPQP